MPIERPSDTGPQIVEKYRARRLLAKMVVQEKLAVQAETHAATFWRQRYVTLYRRIVGVDPTKRHDLRAALGGIAEHGIGCVADTIATLAEPDHVNGLVSGGADDLR